MTKYNLIRPVLGVFIALSASGQILYHTANKIPSTSKVQQGFIAPNKLEVKCEDLDGNGELETQIKIGAKTYLLRDVEGQPVLSEYEVKPKEIQYK